MNPSLPLVAWRRASVERALLAAGLLALSGTLGCTSRPALEHSFETTKYTLENTDKFAVLADPVAPPVSCTGLQQRSLADGRLEVVANLKNRGNGPITVQANCTFSDGTPNGADAETAWQSVTLAEDATQTVRFVAPNTTAKTYTVRVRTAR